MGQYSYIVTGSLGAGNCRKQRDGKDIDEFHDERLTGCVDE